MGTRYRALIHTAGDAGRYIGKTEACASIGSLFREMQYKFGHCLGSIKNQEGNKIGWMFAKCNGKCGIVGAFNIIIEEVKR